MEVDLLLKAKETGKLKFWTMVVYEIEKLKCEQGNFNNELEKATYEELKSLREKNTSNYWGLITIRPRETVTIEQLENITNKIVNKKWLKDNCFWVYEQKGIDEASRGRGIHTHILYKLHGLKQGQKQKSKCQCINEILDTIHRSNLDIADNCVDISTGSRKDLNNVMNYLLGKKKDKDKQLVQQQDVIWRESIGFPAYLGNKEVFNEPS